MFGRGRNEHGELGVGDTSPREEFSLVEGLRGKEVENIWLFQKRVFVSTTDGVLFEPASRAQLQFLPVPE